MNAITHNYEFAAAIKKSDGFFVTTCLDFNISVMGKDENEAFGNLIDAVHNYLFPRFLKHTLKESDIQALRKSKQPKTGTCISVSFTFDNPLEDWLKCIRYSRCEDE